MDLSGLQDRNTKWAHIPENAHHALTPSLSSLEKIDSSPFGHYPAESLHIVLFSERLANITVWWQTWCETRFMG